MARYSDLEHLQRRVSRLCRSVSPPRLDVNVWQEGEHGEAAKLIHTTALNRSPDAHALEIFIEAKEKDAHS